MPNDDPGATHRRGDVAILGVACMLIFMSFATLQGINSSILDPGVAFKSLGSLYVFFAFCNMFAAAFIVERIGCRAALFLASLTYTAFALANVAALYHSDDTDLQVAILIPFSILTGLGASVLWAAQGVYVTRCALKEHVGKYTSLFFGIFWFAQIFGPVLTSALLEAEIDRILVFKILAAVGFSGSILLVYLWAFRPEPSNPYAPIAEANVEINSTTDQAATSPPARKLKFLETLRIMATRSMILLIPLYYTTSIEQAFSGGSLPLFIKTENSTKDLGTKLYLQAVFGTTLMVSSFFIGSVTDRFGSRPLVLLDFFLHVGAMSTLWLLRPLNNFPVLVLCAIALAFSDSLLMNQIYKLLGTLYPRKADTPTAFAAYKFHQSLCTGFMLFGSKSLLDSDNVPKMWAWTLIVGAMLAVAVAGVFAATASYARDGVDGEIVNERTPLLSDGAQGSTGNS
ncbi:major facilitator superfamily domain-containing protein [Chytriomyces sp. MP71]|nr:major facilitator superfamily domain-containing protein [Chytriomyces sp. MP71]